MEGDFIWSRGHMPGMTTALFDLLLGAQVVGMAALLLAAVDCTRVQACVALAADHLVTVVLLGKLTKGWLNDATAQTQHQVQGGLFLDVVVGQGAAILQLFAREYQPLLVRWDAFLVLDLGLDILDGVTGLDLKSDGLADVWLLDLVSVAAAGCSCRREASTDSRQGRRALPRRLVS